MKYINSLDEALAIITPEECLQPCVITDPNRPNNPVVYVTQEFERQTGYAREDVLGRNCRLMQGPDTNVSEAARIQYSLDRMVPIEAELLNYRKDGSPFWNQLSIRPDFSEVGKLRSFVASMFIRPIEARQSVLVAAE